MSYTVFCEIEPEAEAKLDAIYAADPNAEPFITATIEAIRDGDIHVPRDCNGHIVRVPGRTIHLIVSSEGERISRIQYVGIDDVRG